MRIEPCTPYYLTVTASSIVSNRNCIVQSITLTPAGAASEILLYDNAATSTSVKLSVKAVANGASVCIPLTGSGLEFSNGCVAVVTGAGATATLGLAKI